MDTEQASVEPSELLALSHHVINGAGIPSHLIDEAFSEALVASWEAVVTFDCSRGVPIRAWIVVRIRYALRSFISREWRHHVVQPLPDADWSFNAPANPEGVDREDWLDLQAALATMNPQAAQMVIALGAGYPVASISRMFKVAGPDIPVWRDAAMAALSAKLA